MYADYHESEISCAFYSLHTCSLFYSLLNELGAIAYLICIEANHSLSPSFVVMVVGNTCSCYDFEGEFFFFF